MPRDGFPPAPHKAPAPPSRSHRFWLPVITVAALAVLLVGGYMAINRTSSSGTEPSAGGATQAADSNETTLPPATASLSAGPSAPASTSASPSAKVSSKSSAKPEKASAGHTIAGWPGPNNTGVPAGTKLKTYRSSCTIQKAGTVIDSATMNCDVTILAANVTIKRSKINGLVFLDTDRAGSAKWSLTLVDSEVDAGVQERAAVSYGNLTVLRSNIHGGITSVQCGEHSSTCVVQDSYLHGQSLPDNADWHLGGFLSNGGHNIRIRHNYIVCTPPVNSVGEGCTGDLNLLGDFAAISDVVIENNFLGANNSGISYCLYGGSVRSKPYPNANKVVVRDNVFERGKNGKCGSYGPVSSFDVHGSGNVWSNNTWHGGGAVMPAM